MNLLFSFNKSVIFQFLNCIHSIKKNGGYSYYHVYILHSDLTEDDQTLIDDHCGDRVQCTYIYIDEHIFDEFPIFKRYPKQIYYRIIAPLVLPKNIDRILYLDTDIVVINSLRTLMNIEMEDNAILGCTHIHRVYNWFNRIRLNGSKNTFYINTGVMVFNLNIMRNLVNIDEICMFVNQYKKRLMLPDQDIIFSLYGEKIKLVDTMIYNLSDRILKLYNINILHSKLNLEWIRNHVTIIHYCGKNKPWNLRYFGILDVFYKENRS